MGKEYKQVNYKLPPDIVEALNAKAKEEGTTATNLVLRGLEHVLGLSSEPKAHSIDSNLYSSIQTIESRLESLEAHSIEEDIYSRIFSLENSWSEFVAQSIESNIYGRIARIEQLIEALQQDRIDSRIDTEPNATSIESIDSGIDESIKQESIAEAETEIPKEESQEEGATSALTPEEPVYSYSEEEEEFQIMTTSEVVKLQPGLSEKSLLMRRRRKKLPTNVGNYIVDFYDKNSKARGRTLLWSVRAMQKSLPSIT